jgi:rare lipoprotein A
LSRPNIGRRALRARLAPLAIGSLAALHLSPPAPAAAAATLLQSAGAPFRTLPRARGRLSFVRVHAELNVLEGSAASVTGALVPGRAGHLVELQRHERRRWRTVARSFTGGRGRFRLSYTPPRLGEQGLRLAFPGDYADRASTRRLGALGVFRLAGASWYGGGGGLACGGWLTSSTLGVANKTLPCGTLVTLRYGARSVTVPVIDRGPYVAGRDFDLTEATKRALGFEGVGEVWSSR